MEQVTDVRHLAESLLEEGQFLVDVAVSGLQGPQKVTISMDGDRGVTIDDCASLSRKLSAIMEERGMIGENFTLEVSTPGTDKPLVLKRQYAKNTGRRLKVYITGNPPLEGKLAEVTEDAITLETETGEGKKKELKAVTVAFASIEKAVVQISFK